MAAAEGTSVPQRVDADAGGGGDGGGGGGEAGAEAGTEAVPVAVPAAWAVLVALVAAPSCGEAITTRCRQAL